MESTRNKAFEFVKLDEGGYSNDPEDNGGPTKFGITLQRLVEFRHHHCTAEDVRKLREEEALAIYLKNYWNPTHCDEIPLGLDYFAFDSAILHGPRITMEFLQTSVGVISDGKWGPKTEEAVAKCDPKEAIKRLENLRRRRCKNHEDWARFGRGWTNRINRAVKRANGLLDVSS